MKILNKKWFTLIEFLIAITIFFILVMMSFANYIYYQNISKVKISLKEISQSINNSRNLALSWLNINKKNQNVGIYFEKWSNKALIYNFDFDLTNIPNLKDIVPYKETVLQNWVKINNINSWEDLDNIFIYYSSIFAKVEFYTLKNDNSISKVNFNDIKIKLSYKYSSNFPLLRELTYKKLTNVVDY